MSFYQIHPLGLCNTSDDNDLYEYGWVGVVKLLPPDELNEPCFTLLEKVTVLFFYILYVTCSFAGKKPQNYTVFLLMSSVEDLNVSFIQLITEAKIMYPKE